MKTLIKGFKKTFKECDELDYKSKKQKILFKDLFYFSVHNLRNSHTITNTDMKNKGISNVTHQAFSKKKATCDPSLFDRPIKFLKNLIYQQQTRRYIAVDGSHFNIDSAFIEEDYKLSQNKLCCVAKMSALYDVDNLCPVDIVFSNKAGEREILCEQLKNVRANDVIIGDRGYYSQKLVDELKSRGIHFILRMKRNSASVQKLLLEERDECYLSNKVKVVQYLVNDNEYFLLTDLCNKSVNELNTLYRKRWKVETSFDTIKNKIILKEGWLKSLKESTIQIDVKCIFFLLLLQSYISKIKNVKDRYKIEVKNSFNVIINVLLYVLLYKNPKVLKKELVDKILKIIENISIVLVRNYESKPRQNCKPKSVYYKK